MAFAAAVEAFNIVAGRNRAGACPAQSGGLMAQRLVLLITGAGRGIGAATAKLAAARGFDVARQLQDRRATAACGRRRGQGAGPQGGRHRGRHGGRSRRRTHVQDRGREARAAHPFRLQHRHPGTCRTARRGQLRDDARGDRGQRAGRAVVAAARDPPHVEEARRAGRLDRAALLGRGRHRRPQ